MNQTVRITIDQFVFDDEDVTVKQLLDIAEEHPGNDVLEVIIQGARGVRVFRVSQTVDSWDIGLRAELEALMGSSIFEE